MMREDFKIKFKNQIETLKRLMGIPVDDKILKRVEDIYYYARDKWLTNLKRLEGKKVKYLLIAEAPPWSAEGEDIKYFYGLDDETKSHLENSTLLKSLSKSFFGDSYRISSGKEFLNDLSHKGLLLIDILPFAINYKPFKNKKEYASLINECLPFFNEQVNNPMILWADDVRVAFAFKVAGLKIMSALNYKLILPSKQEISLSEHSIVANGAGYPDKNLIRKVLSLDAR
jgi:hypothetical protein